MNSDPLSMLCRCRHSSDNGSEFTLHHRLADTIGGCQLTSPTRTPHGNAARTSTSTVASANTSRNAPASPTSNRPRSTTDPARFSTGPPPPRSSTNYALSRPHPPVALRTRTRGCGKECSSAVLYTGLIGRIKIEGSLRGNIRVHWSRRGDVGS